MHFGVEGSRTSVSAWSDTRLPFEPHGWQTQYRQELREALQALRPRPGEGLLAEYFSPDRAFVDIENLLLYNVGMGVFAPLTTAGLTCRRDRSRSKRHEVRYSTVEPLPDPGTGPLIGEVAVDVGMSVPRTAGQWWATFREAASLLGRVDGHTGADAQRSAFAADIVLAGPAPQRMTSLLKPLLDGLISAFHAHDGSDQPVLPGRLTALGLPLNAWQLLVQEDTNCLGRRRLLRPTEAGIAWNPADDRCSAFRIRAQTSSRWSVTAQLRLT